MRPAVTQISPVPGLESLRSSHLAGMRRADRAGVWSTLTQLSISAVAAIRKRSPRTEPPIECFRCSGPQGFVVLSTLFAVIEISKVFWARTCFECLGKAVKCFAILFVQKSHQILSNSEGPVSRTTARGRSRSFMISVYRRVACWATNMEFRLSGRAVAAYRPMK